MSGSSDRPENTPVQGAFDRIRIERVPADRTGRPWHVEVYHQADERHVATIEHMDLSQDELTALYDRAWQALSGNSV